MAGKTRRRRSTVEKALQDRIRWRGRAMRPGILRPWHGECLVLRANDTRIEGRTVARCTGEAYAASGPGERIEHDARAADGVDATAAERIGLLGALDALRRGSWRGRERRSGDLAGVELVTVDAGLVDRVCRWPVLPANCHKVMAAALLGVNYRTIDRWIVQGKLVARGARGKCGSGVRYTVSYPATSRLVQMQGGPMERHPDSAQRMLYEEPDVGWVVDRLAVQRRRETVVRLARWVRTSRGRVDGRKHYWVCPVCRAQGYRLYLAAGAMARDGLTFGAWRFQCRSCSGVISEAGEWNRPGADPFGQWALKMSCGVVSGNDMRGGVSRLLDEG